MKYFFIALYVAFFLCVCHVEYNRAIDQGQDAQKIWTLVVLETKRYGQQPGRYSSYSLSYVTVDIL